MPYKSTFADFISGAEIKPIFPSHEMGAMHNVSSWGPSRNHLNLWTVTRNARAGAASC
jgi:hypothetical protein